MASFSGDAAAASGDTDRRGLRRALSAEEIIMECSSGVSLAINTTRTGYITREELSSFFEAVNNAYGMAKARAAGDRRADEILAEVGMPLADVPAVKLRRICQKLDVDIAAFVEKSEYVAAIAVRTGGSQSVCSLNKFAAWLQDTFAGHPDKLQRIQDIAMDHLVTQQDAKDDKARAQQQQQQRQQQHQPPAGESEQASSSAAAGPGAAGSRQSYLPRRAPPGVPAEGPGTPRTQKRNKKVRRKTMVALDVFAKLDRNHDGSVSRRDFLLACRKDAHVAEYLGLPQKIKQEGGSRAKLETLFQGIDSDSNDEITIEEFVEHFRNQANVGGPLPPINEKKDSMM